MHPAYSVIFFTVSSGSGYGLLALLSLLGVTGSLPGASHFTGVAFGLALAAITFGLLSSTYHLGRPQRSWRAFGQWRSSWLSREGIAAIATYVPAGLVAADAFGIIHLSASLGIFNLAAAVLALATIYCTAMIYRSLATIHQWHNAWTVPNYLILGLAAGAVWMNFLLMVFHIDRIFISVLTVVLLAGALFSKARYWRFIDETSHGSSPESATGLGHLGKVHLFEAPHTEENYLMREMGYRVARTHALRLRHYAKALGFAVPIVLTLAAAWSGASIGIALALLAAATTTAGMLIERWLFFAEARHVVTLFYGRETA